MPRWGRCGGFGRVQVCGAHAVAQAEGVQSGLGCSGCSRAQRNGHRTANINLVYIKRVGVTNKLAPMVAHAV